MSCLICNSSSNKDLCVNCEKQYIYEPLINGYRLKKSRLLHDNVRESRLRKILNKLYNIQNVFEEVVFEWCKNPKTNTCLRFDFGVLTPDGLVLVEFNGEQHYKYVPFFHKTKAGFLEQKYRDSVKKQKAKEMGIPLHIVAYNCILNESNIKRELYKSRVKKERQ